jgi:hypothetical protein
MASHFLIISSETGKRYKRKKLKEQYENIKQAQILQVYTVKRNYGYINNGKTYKTKRK